MLIEKKYHTEAAREMDEIIREEEERKASLSEEERTAEKEEKYAETEEIIRKVQEAERQNFHIVSKEKIKRFSYLAMDALRMAETLLLDVTVRTDGTIGRIRLSTDFFVLNEMCPEKARQIFVDMIKSADDFGIYAKDDLVVIEYIFRVTPKFCVKSNECRNGAKFICRRQRQDRLPPMSTT